MTHVVYRRSINDVVYFPDPPQLLLITAMTVLMTQVPSRFRSRLLNDTDQSSTHKVVLLVRNNWRWNENRGCVFNDVIYLFDRGGQQEAMETSEQHCDAPQHMALDWNSKGINGNVADLAVTWRTTVPPGSSFQMCPLAPHVCCLTSKVRIWH